RGAPPGPRASRAAPPGLGAAGTVASSGLAAAVVLVPSGIVASPLDLVGVEAAGDGGAAAGGAERGHAHVAPAPHEVGAARVEGAAPRPGARVRSAARH